LKAVETLLTGRGHSVSVRPEAPSVIIGERINPTGKKKLAEALRKGDMQLVREIALTQAEQGARVIDVNVGAADVDEERMLPLAVLTAAEATGLPISLDSTHETALPAALKVVGGTPLINSVTGEEASLARVLPLVKEFNTAVIGLTMSDDGIPEAPEDRLRVAEKIVERAARLGIAPERVLIDCLTLTVSADHRAGAVTLQSIRLVREKLGVNLTLGASNVSYGLPDREVLNNHFVALAIAAGVNCPIVDPGKVRGAIVAADLLAGRDEYAQNYIAYYRATHPEA
jgi:5-methyltetrahydrofolate--homocysteine methyltransferase